MRTASKNFASNKQWYSQGSTRVENTQTRPKVECFQNYQYRGSSDLYEAEACDFQSWNLVSREIRPPIFKVDPEFLDETDAGVPGTTRKLVYFYARRSLCCFGSTAKAEHTLAVLP
jgi:hypothetical protein